MKLDLILKLDELLSKGKNRKAIGLVKDKLGGKFMTKFFGLRVKTSSYSIEDGSADKKVKGTKKCVIKRKLKSENYKNCLEATQLLIKINHPQKNLIN